MTHSVKEVAEYFGVGQLTVLGWIRSGELKAINAARRMGTKPKWRIKSDALASFEKLRTPTKPPAVVRRARPLDEIAFYK